MGSEVLFAQNPAESRRLQRAAAQDLITRIAPGVYVQASPGDPEHIAMVVQRHWQKILGRIIPEAVVSHLSAFRGGMTPKGELILSHPTRFNKRMVLPGVVVVLMKGPGPLPGDMPLVLTDKKVSSWISRIPLILRFEQFPRFTKYHPE
ncbi:hypothetical protein [Acidithiobacillus ferrianus]|uniref:hypothetical protein n=1 Tax=Acidithiobacillus ferrianus TaxID=2678518 RepID=UPI0034E50E91